MTLSSFSLLRSLKKPKPFLNLERIAASGDDGDDPALLLKGNLSFTEGFLRVPGCHDPSPLHRTRCANRSNSISVLAEKGAPVCHGPKDVLAAIRLSNSNTPLGSASNTPRGSMRGTPTSGRSSRSSDAGKSPKGWSVDLSRMPSDFGGPMDHLTPGGLNRRPEAPLRKRLLQQFPGAKAADPPSLPPRS
eukprot:EG_transcript_32752